jgi:hypothetical protein
LIVGEEKGGNYVNVNRPICGIAGQADDLLFFRGFVISGPILYPDLELCVRLFRAAPKPVTWWRLGTNFGRRLNPILPKAYLQARYSYAFVERIVGISPNRSNAEVQPGYFLTRRLSLLGMGQWMHTHRGVDYVYGVVHGGLSDDEFLHHDQISKSTLLDIGGGAAYALNRSLQMFLSVAHSVAGRNGHLHAAVVTVGVSRSFGGQREERSAFTGETTLEPRKALVCTCAKSK